MLSTIVIKKLQEIDPEGKLHVCCNGEAILSIDQLPGYYDGGFSYFDEHEWAPEKIYLDDIHDKIVIRSMGTEDFLGDVEGDLSKIDMTNLRDKDDKLFLDWLKKKSDELKQIFERLFNDQLHLVMDKLKEGYEIIQEKKDKIGMFNVMFYLKDGIKDQLCQGDCSVVLRSGFFIFEEKDDFIYWKMDLINGKKYC